MTVFCSNCRLLYERRYKACPRCRGPLTVNGASEAQMRQEGYSAWTPGNTATVSTGSATVDSAPIPIPTSISQLQNVDDPVEALRLKYRAMREEASTIQINRNEMSQRDELDSATVLSEQQTRSRRQDAIETQPEDDSWLYTTPPAAEEDWRSPSQVYQPSQMSQWQRSSSRGSHFGMSVLNCLARIPWLRIAVVIGAVVLAIWLISKLPSILASLLAGTLNLFGALLPTILFVLLMYWAIRALFKG